MEIKAHGVQDAAGLPPSMHGTYKYSIADTFLLRGTTERLERYNRQAPDCPNRDTLAATALLLSLLLRPPPSVMPECFRSLPLSNPHPCPCFANPSKNNLYLLFSFL